MLQTALQLQEFGLWQLDGHSIIQEISSRFEIRAYAAWKRNQYLLQLFVNIVNER